MLYTVNCGTGGDNYSTLERDGIHTCIIQQNLWSWKGCILYTVNCGTWGDHGMGVYYTQLLVVQGEITTLH